ncbi:MAG: FAD:protein FMN transferase, partial [Solirubrobacteraceae bacterium]
MSAGATAEAGTAGHRAPAARSPQSPPAVASWEALGTGVVLKVARHDAIAAARHITERLLARLDQTCSRFRPDSDLSRVNASAGAFVRVDPLLIEATEVALRAARLTDGDVDPALGTVLELAGYDRDWRRLDPPHADQQALAPAGAPRVLARRRAAWQAIALNRARGCVRVPDGVKLDLGATAKA